MNIGEHYPSVLWKLVMCVVFRFLMEKQYISKELNFKLENDKAFQGRVYI